MYTLTHRIDMFFSNVYMMQLRQKLKSSRVNSAIWWYQVDDTRIQSLHSNTCRILTFIHIKRQIFLLFSSSAFQFDQELFGFRVLHNWPLHKQSAMLLNFKTSLITCHKHSMFMCGWLGGAAICQVL